MAPHHPLVELLSDRGDVRRKLLTQGVADVLDSVFEQVLLGCQPAESGPDSRPFRPVRGSPISPAAMSVRPGAS
jgi:hypothetical protein